MRAPIVPSRRLFAASAFALPLALAAALAGCGPTKPSTPVVIAPPTPAPPRASPVTDTGKPKIALLLPLTGRAAAIGQSMQEAAELALFEAVGRDIAISTYDTGDTPEGAVDAFAKARAQGLALALGPLFAPSANAVAPLARQAGVNLISFSNDETVARSGAYMMGIAVGPQVRRVAEHAIERGVARFATLAPSTGFGEQAAKSLEEYLASRNVAFAPAEFFDPAGLDFSGPARRVAAKLGEPGGAALFLPASGRALGLVSASLVSADVTSRKVRFLGTGVWDDREIWAQGAVAGGWYAAPDPARRADFERRYVATFGKPPHRLATLAYDAVGFAGRLARLKPGGDYSAAAIADPAGHVGADGPMRFRADGRVERSLAVLEIVGERTIVVSPAPATFARPSN